MAKNSEKSDGAFRTIREVADWLGVPTHVLRFWESKFDDVSPVKGSGGRRYYRPEDMRLLGGIKILLHDEGQTIRGVADRIREGGTGPIMDLSPDLDHSEVSTRKRRVIRSGDDGESGRILPFARGRGTPVSTEAPRQPEDAIDATVAASPADGVTDQGPTEPDAPEPDTVQPDAPDAVAEAPGVDPAPAEAPSDGGATPPRPEPLHDATPALPPSDGIGSTPDIRPTMEAPPEAAIPVPPTVQALHLVRAVTEIDGADRRQFKRVVRKLRGLIEEVEDDLSA